MTAVPSVWELAAEILDPRPEPEPTDPEQLSPIAFAEARSRGQWHRVPHLELIEREVGHAIETGGRLIISVSIRHGKSEFIATGGRNKDGGLSGAAVQPETKVWGVGYNYNFSKRTTFMARYADVKNNAAGVQNLNGSQLTINGADADPKGFGVGFRHTF